MIDNLKNLLFALDALDIHATVNAEELEGLDPFVILEFESAERCLRFVEAMNDCEVFVDVYAKCPRKPTAFLGRDDLEAVCAHLTRQTELAA